MDKTNKIKSKAVRPARNLREAMSRVPERLREEFATHTKEEMAEKLTAYEPGVPHYWFGRPVAPITKEDLLAFWNGEADIEPRYLDVVEPEAAPAEMEIMPTFQK
jgi:hypothetical protein